MERDVDIALIEGAKEAWGQVVAQELRAQMALMGLRNSGKLMRLMQPNYRRFSGVIEGVSFRTNRVGMIKLNGVREQIVTVERGPRAGASYRLRNQEPQDWYTPVMRTRLPELSNTLAQLHADVIVQESKVVNFSNRKA